LIQRLTSYNPGDVGVSSITIAELAYGAQKSSQTQKNMAALEQFLLSLEIADFDQQASMIYGAIHAKLEQEGNRIGSMDMLISAHALRLKVTLVTNNIKEFQRIPSLELEDWMV
jgi:tRNA(fMet)-specific endonuclease VapC